MKSRKSFSGQRTRAEPPGRRWCAAYLALQAVLIAAWWALLWRVPGAIELFRNDGVPDAAILDLWLADGVLLLAGSALGSFLVAGGHRFAQPVLWILCGGLAYETLVCLGGSLRSGGGWLAVALMGPATLLTWRCALGLRA